MRRLLPLGIVLDVLDVFVCQLQEPLRRRGVRDLTRQPSALLDLLNECRVQRLMV